MPYTYRFFGLYRFMLAALVMLQHFGANAAPDAIVLMLQPLEPGSVAVLAFFALSGFIIAEAADQAYQGRPGAFLVNRALRIVPHFVTAMLLSVAAHWYMAEAGALRVERTVPGLPEDALTGANLFLNFFSILPYVDRLIGYNFVPIAWAVRIEVAFYGAVALALWLASTRRDLSFGGALAALGAVFLLVFAATMLKKAPAMFGFVPYFAFGAALYFCGRRARVAAAVMAVSLPLMLLHFLSLPVHHPALGFARAVPEQLALLVLLLGLMVLASRVKPKVGQKGDAWLGRFTYPLYLYHYVVLVLASSSFLEYSAWTFAAGMAAAILFSVGMSYLLDPVIDRWRDQVRSIDVPLGHRISAKV